MDQKGQEPKILKGPWANPKAPHSHGPSNNGGGDGGHMTPESGERLAKLEGLCAGLRDSIEGLRHGHNLIMGLLAKGFAVVVAVVGYAITRIDNIPSDFERMNQTIVQAIIASKQQPPQVLLVPSPPTQVAKPEHSDVKK
jgi:hypothetical protein